MALPPTSFRLPFILSSDVHPDVQSAIRYAFSGLKDLNDAVSALAKKTTTTTTVVTTAAGGGGGSSGPVAGSIGVVNQQTVGAYTLQAGDFGAIVVLDTAPIFAVTLSSLTAPFFSFISNQCAGVATLTPDSGTVNGFASWPVPAGGFAIVGFDGTNWFALPVCPQNTPPVFAQFLTGYNSTTGQFSQSKVTDLYGLVTVDSGATVILDSGVTIVFDSGASLVNANMQGTTSIRNLQIFANNAAALAGGLVIGNLYRDGGDPDHVCITH